MNNCNFVIGYCAWARDIQGSAIIEAPSAENPEVIILTQSHVLTYSLTHSLLGFICIISCTTSSISVNWQGYWAQYDIFTGSFRFDERGTDGRRQSKSDTRSIQVVT